MVEATGNGRLERDARLGVIAQAFRLEYITVAWMVVEATVAIASGLAAASITLIAFGLDSVIELLSALVLIWRLRVELRQGRELAESAERKARRIGAVLLFALAVYVVIAAGWSLWTGKGEEFSWPGLLVSVAALPIMWILARRKLVAAAALGSRALRADAVESITCGWLSLVVVVGLVAQWVTDAWWVDAVTSLGIVYFLVKEGREAWLEDECCASDGGG
ncbi:MAG: cation transporter [Proteobacteria bacterium]|nr:cation transporter [Pseudomonadota bacterium]